MYRHMQNVVSVCVAVLCRPDRPFCISTRLFTQAAFLVPAILHYCSAAALPCVFFPNRHAAELRAAGADKICIVNSEAGLNLGAQLLSDLGSSETSVSLLRRGINEALTVRTAADNSRRDAPAAEPPAAAAENGTSSNGSSSSEKKKKLKQVELFVLDGKHAYGLRADALARAVSPDLPCTECPLVRQQQEIAALSSLDESLIPGALSSSSSVVSSAASAADVDGAAAAAAAAAAAVPAAGLNGSKSAAAAAVNASVGSNAAGGPGAGSV
jgi:hypothetical protein